MGFVLWWADEQRLIFSFSIWLLVMGWAEVILIPTTTQSPKPLPAIQKRHSMGLFDKLFKRTEIKLAQAKRYVSDTEIEQRNKDFVIKFEQTKILFSSSLNIYNSQFCQCAYPRFQQIINIDCSNTGNSFKCYDTDLLIDLSKVYFETQDSELSDENTNETWTCKKCGSTYEYGWSDFSIYVERQKLKLKNLTIKSRGQPVINPIPIYLGLIGHSYPSKTEIAGVDFTDFEAYMTEK